MSLKHTIGNPLCTEEWVARRVCPRTVRVSRITRRRGIRCSGNVAFRGAGSNAEVRMGVDSFLPRLHRTAVVYAGFLCGGEGHLSAVGAADPTRYCRLVSVHM